MAFLTRLPIGRSAVDAATVGAAAPYFPLVGALLLLGAGATAHVAGIFMPALLAGALGLAFLTLATGALHLDALADAADALGGGTPDDRLRIMRDHAIGAFGASALCLTLVIEVAALAALVDVGVNVLLFAAVGAASRATAPMLAATLPYARRGEAAASPVSGFTTSRGTAALAAAAAVSAVSGVEGLLVLGAALAVASGAYVLCRRWIGGVSGDTLGATIQLSEAVGLVVAVAIV